jgi:general secretion pathway protein D
MSTSDSWLRRLGALLVAAALCGCAAQSAYREGQARLAQGQLEPALERFQEALRLDPQAAQYRLAATRTRERVVAARVARGDQAALRGDVATAEQEYRQALAAQPGAERAEAGLRALEQRRRWEQQLRQAEGAASRSDWSEVRNLLRPLVLEGARWARVQALLRQADDALMLAARAATPARALAEAYRKPISIEFRDTPIRTIFEVLARSSGLNFVLDKDVRGEQRASISLKNATIEAAVGMLLPANQLELRVLDPNSVLIYPNTAAKQREYQSLSVRSFYLAYADAKTVANTLKTLLKLREPVVDEKLNLVIVRDSPEAIRVAERIVAMHDVPEPEVMLEVEILEVKRSRLLDLGVRWPDQLSLSPLAAGGGSTLTVDDLRNLNSRTIGAGVSPLTIRANQADVDANLLANPRIRARNREKAKIHIGERVPNITTTSTATGFVAESVTYVDVGLKLDVEPTIYPDDEVAIRVALEVSNIISQIQTKSGTLAYQIGTRTATTVLRLKDGENQVLAGLINDEDRSSGNKIPGLGEVPLIGRLFGAQTDDSTKTEIVLSITPRVVRNLQRPDASIQEFDSGTEATIGARATDGTAAPARPPAPPQPAPVQRPPVPAPAAPAPATQTSPSTTTGSGTATTPVVGVGVPVPASTVSARWAGPTLARVGDTVSLQLLVRGDEPVSAVSLAMGLDLAAVQLVGVSEGTFLRQGGAAADFTSQVDARGQLVVSTRRTGGGAGSGASLEAPLLTLQLKVLARPADGVTRVQMIDFVPAGAGARGNLSTALPAPFVLTVQP